MQQDRVSDLERELLISNAHFELLQLVSALRSS